MNPACPHLPRVSPLLDHTVTRRHGADRGPDFAFDALRYCHSLWLEGKPAQAILQIDKAMMSGHALHEGARKAGADPYLALAWILDRAADGSCGFLGNPVRHFQHLATRMSGPHRELRIWRAWCCMHLAEDRLATACFPRDGRQMVREGIWLPGRARCLARLAALGWPGEAVACRAAFRG